MNAASIARSLVLQNVRASEATSGLTALQRFDAWAKSLGGEVFEFETERRLSSAYRAHESNRLDELVATVLHSIAANGGLAPVRSALTEFHDISVAQMRRFFNKLSFLAPVLKGIGFVLRVTAMTALFVFLSEAASYLYTVHPW